MRLLSFVSVALLIFLSSQAAAQTSRNITNSSTVLSACSIRTLQSIRFEAFDPLNIIPSQGQGSIGLSCTKGSYAVYINSGFNRGKTTWSISRGDTYTYDCSSRLGKGGQYLSYTIHRSPTSEPVKQEFYLTWPTVSNNPIQDCSTRTFVFGAYGFDSAEERIIPIYAKLSPSTAEAKAATAGSYTDYLTFTVNF